MPTKSRCDEQIPACKRCVKRNEICTGYRDDSTLLFRDENAKAAFAAHAPVRRRASSQSARSRVRNDSSASISGKSSTSAPSDDASSPCARPKPLSSPQDDEAISQFFSEYVVYPCTQNSTPGFLEQLPCLFEEVQHSGRIALRMAVEAVSFANIATKGPRNDDLVRKAQQCYGSSLEALANTLEKKEEQVSDYTLMTVVVLDLFEVILHSKLPVSLGTYYFQSIFTPSPLSRTTHSEGLKLLLRLRGPSQIYSERGWSLFRLAHHRIQRTQLSFKHPAMPEQSAWLNSLNDGLPGIRGEKENLEISKICQRARELQKRLRKSSTGQDSEVLQLVKEMHALDQTASTWRVGSQWAFRILTNPYQPSSTTFPEHIHIYPDLWIAYEWNYHRTARIIMHEHLLKCLASLSCHTQTPIQSSYQPSTTTEEEVSALSMFSRHIINTLIEEIFSTVPQLLGDVNSLEDVPIQRDLEKTGEEAEGRGTKAIGAYFLLWSIKVVKSTNSATEMQRERAGLVLERLRKVGGMFDLDSSGG
ncbi:hypothetical protein BP5796_01743 [Coleophoma crateriformis]|uniref:Zn(2)-C6 fungal-type domain-containing protein n=1 Tax=Coleophoma crateriformis TaxID=565419 RepID=A0A3D8T1H3_9HELO|nr:hypothetical protein BP5796_01743 [Coleophoma crateriformis]